MLLDMRAGLRTTTEDAMSLQETAMPINDPRDHPVIDPYVATPASIAHAKAVAAMERAVVADQLKGLQERRARTLIEQLVQEHGAIYVITLVQSVADCREAEGHGW